MGESKLKRVNSQEMVGACAGVQTAGGRVQVRWEFESVATPMGQLAYFIAFLTLTGLWSRRWVSGTISGRISIATGAISGLTSGLSRPPGFWAIWR